MEGSDIKYEQISPPYQIPYPAPFWLPPPPYQFIPPLDSNNNWYQRPYTFPHSYLYPIYNSDCDSPILLSSGWYPGLYIPYSGNCQIPLTKSHVNTPNIIITNSSDNEDHESEQEKSQTKDLNKRENEISSNTQILNNEQGSENSAIDKLSKKLGQIVNTDLNLNTSKDDKKYVGDIRKEIQNEDYINTSSPISTEKSSEIENFSDVVCSSDEESESTSTDDPCSKNARRQSFEMDDGIQLQSIKSVTDINIYDTDKNKQEIRKVNSTNYNNLLEMVFDSDEDEDENEDEKNKTFERTNSSTSSCSDLIEEFEELIEDTEENTEMQQLLSVIYEESELDEKDRAKSQASTIINENSTTITNDGSCVEESDDDSEAVTENIEEDCKLNQTEYNESQNLVTVRLPLKLSFSKSPDDENIATVTVGNSEIQDENSITRTVPQNENEADVSVTINLPSKRVFSQERKKRNIVNLNSVQADDSDSEVSVSFSLPMKKDKLNNDNVVTENYDVTIHEGSDYKENFNEINANEDHNSSGNDNSMTDYYLKIRNKSEQVGYNKNGQNEIEEYVEKNKEYDEEIVCEIEWTDESQSDEDEDDAGFTYKNGSGFEKQEQVENDRVIKQEQFGETFEITEKSCQEEDDNMNNEKLRKREEYFKLESSSLNNQISSSMQNNTNSVKSSLCNSLVTSNDEIKVSVRDKIAIYESNSQSDKNHKNMDHLKISSKKMLSRNSSIQKSESEMEEDDSGVTSDLSKQISETDTECEDFPELRKMTRYQRAATHSRLFKLLQEESNSDKDENIETEKEYSSNSERIKNETQKARSKEKIIHNVSITRRTNPDSIGKAETMAQRRERLGLSLPTSSSIDADNLSSSNSPSSPSSQNSVIITDKLVDELIQSLLKKNVSQQLGNFTINQLQAAARKVLEESFGLPDNNSLKDEVTSHTDCSFPDSTNQNSSYDYNILPSKAFRSLQEQQSTRGKRKPWVVKCPQTSNSEVTNYNLNRTSVKRYRSSSVAPSSISTSENLNNEFKRGASLSKL